MFPLEIQFHLSALAVCFLFLVLLTMVAVMLLVGILAKCAPSYCHALSGVGRKITAPCLVFTALVFSGLAVFVTGMTISIEAKPVYYLLMGARTEGVITGMGFLQHTHYYQLEARYQANNTRYSVSSLTEIPDFENAAYDIGDKITVLYLKSNPSHAMLLLPWREKPDVFPPATAVAVLAAMWLAVLLAWKRAGWFWRQFFRA
ncbi:MAG: DUF3592 domain-containing protein [Zoogloeaceae bacterium]|jgi:hypothetical protein|nr:DUF3592 domain-containing protein [Zoogloeaceae bacterium]